jgi:UDP-N-acetylglucosamine 4-epimerase
VYAAVIPKFIQSMIRHEDPTAFGDGEQTRDFTHVKNVVDANILAMTTVDEKALNQTYNIAAGQTTSVNQLFEFLKELLSDFDQEIGSLDMIHTETRLGDIPHSTASIEKAKEFLGYSPTIDVEQGLKMAIGWYWDNLN